MPTRPSRVPRPIGQDLVEFAIIVPILFLFVFGVIDLARVFHALVVVNNTAREGARFISQFGGMNKVNVSGGTDYWVIQTDEVESVVRNEAGNQGLNPNEPGVVISATCPTHSPSDRCISGDLVRVSVTYPFRLITGLVFSDSTINITRRAEMIYP